MSNKVIKDYLESVKANINKIYPITDNFKLYKCDVLNLFPALKADSFDVSITSPPYGDNKTTVPYGQFSMLALCTIPRNDIVLEGWELDNFSIIDSKSLGKIRFKAMLTNKECFLLEPYLNQIYQKKHQKVICFFIDYFTFLREIARLTKKILCLLWVTAP